MRMICLGIRRMENDMSGKNSRDSLWCNVQPRLFALATMMAFGAGVALTSGCVMVPPGPSPILSRLSPEQSGVSATAHPLTPAERARYDAIDRQALADQERAIAAEAAAQAWARTVAPPVTMYGGYYSGYYGGYYGGGWGYGYPGWGWGW